MCFLQYCVILFCCIFLEKTIWQSVNKCVGPIMPESIQQVQPYTKTTHDSNALFASGGNCGMRWKLGHDFLMQGVSRIVHVSISRAHMRIVPSATVSVLDLASVKVGLPVSNRRYHDSARARIYNRLRKQNTPAHHRATPLTTPRAHTK